MRLPSSLLGRVRVGVGVGAVLLGGCDLVEEAKARVLGDEQAAVAEEQAAEAEAPVAEAQAPAAPEPLLLPRSGVAGLVEETVARSEASASGQTALPPVNDLGRPATPTDGERTFVPYAGSSGAIASIPPSFTRPEIAEKKPRPRAKPRVASPDEPCDPSLAVGGEPPVREWTCGPCGRG